MKKLGSSETPQVVLHGFTQGPSMFDGLVKCPRLAPWLSGHGPQPDHSARKFEDEVLRIASQIEKHAPDEPVELIGYSMGARVGLGLLARRPDLVESALLIGGNPGLEDEGARAQRVRWETDLVALLEAKGLDGFLKHWERLPLFATQSGLPNDVQAAQHALRRSHTAEGLAHALRVLGLGVMPSFWEDLPRIDRPVTLVVGEHDAKFRGIAEQAVAFLPHGRLTVIPGAGHNPLLEAPEALRALLSSPLSSR